MRKLLLHVFATVVLSIDEFLVDGYKIVRSNIPLISVSFHQPAVQPENVVDLYLHTVRTSSRRAAAGRAELLANFLGGAVWGVFRENANCGDPPGTLPGNLPGNLRVPCTFRRGLIWKIRQKSGKIWAKSSKICQN